MPCSAVTLSIGTVAAVLSVALLAIAFSTDNWLRVDVKRERLRVSAGVFCRDEQDSEKCLIAGEADEGVGLVARGL